MLFLLTLALLWWTCVVLEGLPLLCSNVYSADHWSPVQSQWSHCIVETLCNTELLYIRGVRKYVVQSSCVHFTSWCLFDHVRVTSEPRRMDLILLNWVHLTLSWTVMLWLLDLYVVVLFSCLICRDIFTWVPRSLDLPHRWTSGGPGG